MDTTRISVFWSISPCGNVALSSYFTEIYVSQIISAFPGLRDMINQIPRYHIHNLVDQIRQMQRNSVDKPSISPKESEVSQIQEEPDPTSPSPHYPFISNTIQHLSQSSDKVSHLCFTSIRRFGAGVRWTPRFGRSAVKITWCRTRKCSLLPVCVTCCAWICSDRASESTTSRSIRRVRFTE